MDDLVLDWLVRRARRHIRRRSGFAVTASTWSPPPPTMVRFQDVVFPVAPTTEPQEPVEEEDDEPTWPIQPAFLSADGVAVHVEYDIDNPPPVPGSEWTRFICISDTHSRTFQVSVQWRLDAGLS